MRGTAILTKTGITLTNITKIPSGCARAVEHRGTLLVNVYTPSATAKRNEREHFYNTELPYLLRTTPARMILGGDFNCVLVKADTTGQYQYSRALAELINGFAIMDTWHQNPVRPAYTHHFNNGTTRIDQIYTTQELLAKKIGIEIVAAAFTDHHAVKLRIVVDTPILRMGRGHWKINTAMFPDVSGQVKL